MGGVVLPFVGKPEKSARTNLQGFIARARNFPYFKGANAVHWNDLTWDLRNTIATRDDSRTLVLHFNTWESKGRVKKPDRVPLPPGFCEAARALVADAIPSGKMSAPHRRLMALRCVEKAFRDLGREADVTLIDHAVLDRAATIILSETEDDAGYLPALAALAEEMSAKSLTVIPLSWKNPAPPKTGQRRSGQVLEVGGTAISEKLPHIKCVLDLATVFQGARSGADMVTTGWFALAMFAPSRVSEIVTLPVSCETTIGDVYGLSWQPSKGGDPLTKFAVSTEWADVARTAISRLRDWGAPARRAAAWYRKHPNQLYLPPGCEHLRGQDLTQHEVYAILGIGDRSFNDFALSRIIEPTDRTTQDPQRTGGRVRSRLYHFASLEQYVLSQLPEQLPWADKKFGLRAEDALFCVPRHSMRANYAAHLHVPELISSDQIHTDLNQIKATIFVRHSLFDPSTGRPWTLTSHQPRHLLNTLAQSKSISQALIAFWSGRKSVDQNSWYNHIPDEVLIELYVAMGESAPRPVKAVGPLADKVTQRARREAISTEEAMRLEVGSVISTRFGLCRHQYSLTPCPKDKNCIGCGENTFVKGNKRHLAEARAQLQIAESATARCLQAISDGEPDVHRWLDKHEAARQRWSLAVDMMLDPAIEDGTLITLPPPAVSQTKAGLSLEIRKVEGCDDGLDDYEALLAQAGDG